MERKGLFYLLLIFSRTIIASDISIVVEQKVGGCSSGCIGESKAIDVGAADGDAGAADGAAMEGDTTQAPTTTTTATTTTEEELCHGDGLVKSDHFCYFFSQGEKMLYEVADACSQKEMEIVKITNEEEYQFVKSNAGDLTTRGVWAGLQYFGGEWIWTLDRTPATYFKWSPGQPQNPDGYHTYVGIYSTDMQTVYYTQWRRYICQSDLQ